MVSSKGRVAKKQRRKWIVMKGKDWICKDDENRKKKYDTKEMCGEDRETGGGTM